MLPRQGDVRLPKVPLPEILADELSRKRITAVPTIPIIGVPTQFEVPDAHGRVADMVKLSSLGVRIVDDGVRLEFALDHQAGDKKQTS